MAAVDFREIPPAKGGGKDADSWELFARDFFVALGLEIEVEPGRGADAGRDLLIVEQQAGQLAKTRVRWVVSCKHYVHSGGAVSDRDEPDPLGRVRKFKADGFMAFYSTLPSSTLVDTFDRLRAEARFGVYDAARIEGHLVGNGRLKPLFRRYFPKSFEQWQRDPKGPVEVFTVYEPLPCTVCGKDLLTDPSRSLIGFAESRREGEAKYRTEVLYWACKGACDRGVRNAYWDDKKWTTGWADVADLILPTLFMRFVMSAMNRVRKDPDYYSDLAFSQLKELILILSQVDMRNTSEQDWTRIKTVLQLPEGI